MVHVSGIGQISTGSSECHSKQTKKDPTFVHLTFYRGILATKKRKKKSHRAILWSKQNDSIAITEILAITFRGEKWVVVVQSLSRVALCDFIDCSIPGFLVLHYLPEFAQTHVHWVSDANQPSHPIFPNTIVKWISYRNQTEASGILISIFICIHVFRILQLDSYHKSGEIAWIRHLRWKFHGRMFACVIQLLWQLVFTLIWNAESSLVWHKEFPRTTHLSPRDDNSLYSIIQSLYLALYLGQYHGKVHRTYLSTYGN